MSETGQADISNQIVGYEERDPDTLRLNPRNPRIHPKRQMRALATVLDDVGWAAGVLVNRRTNTVIDGHARVELARERGETSIPVTLVDISEEDERIALLTFDQIATTERDDDALRDLLDEAQGASDGELGDLIADLRDELDTSERETDYRPTEARYADEMDEPDDLDEYEAPVRVASPDDEDQAEPDDGGGKLRTMLLYYSDSEYMDLQSDIRGASLRHRYETSSEAIRISVLRQAQLERDRA